jgi:hypothetical protein
VIRKLFCAALVTLGVTLDTYFYAFRFIADGLPVVVAVASGVALELLLSFAVYNTRRSKVFVVIAVAITLYAVVQTSAGQTFALLSHTAGIGVETETGTATFTMAQCKENVARLTEEANIITGQLKSLQSVKARAEYAGAISRANERLNQITRERTRLMDTLLKTSASTVSDARNADNQKSIYNFYAGMVNWQKDDWLKFVFHFFLSVLLAIMAPVGILSWGHAAATRPEFSRQQIEMFVAAAWYRVRNNTGSTVLSEVAYNELLQKRGHPVETGVYFALMNKCMQCGLVNTGGFALEKDHKKVIEKLSGERPAAGIAIKNKMQKIKAYAAAFVSARRLNYNDAQEGEHD